MKYIPKAMESGNQGKSSSLLIISMIFEIAHFDPK